MVLAASIRPADHADVDTMVDSVIEARVNLDEAGVEVEIEEAVADKGYHATDTIELAESLNIRTYIPERKAEGANGTGATCRKRNVGPCSTIGVACVARRASGCNVCGANGWNGASPTSATPAARGAVGFTGWRKCKSVTRLRRWRGTWACSCARCSESARRAASRPPAALRPLCCLCGFTFIVCCVVCIRLNRSPASLNSRMPLPPESSPTSNI